MRNLEDIERDLAVAREALSSVEGAPAEVYSRIVGYYRSVRNWNRGKREEYGERRLFQVAGEGMPGPAPSQPFSGSIDELRLLLFVRAACPGCIPAKAAAARLGVRVELVSADSPAGISEAVRYNVLSTPTAILLSAEDKELARASSAEGISRLLESSGVPAIPASLPSALSAELAIAV
ncbi:MAG: anaerobic ribonucleoside-triphosphate reductase [Treponema sp.]|nr:anaerobic ribonucleoside-triphosphate reductase [Treponema sp.]